MAVDHCRLLAGSGGLGQAVTAGRKKKKQKTAADSQPLDESQPDMESTVDRGTCETLKELAQLNIPDGIATEVFFNGKWWSIEQLRYSTLTETVTFAWSDYASAADSSVAAVAAAADVAQIHLFRSQPYQECINAAKYVDVDAFADDNHGMQYTVLTRFVHHSHAVAATRNEVWNETDYDLKSAPTRELFMRIVHTFWSAFQFTKGWQTKLGIKAAGNSATKCKLVIKTIPRSDIFAASASKQQAQPTEDWGIQDPKEKSCVDRFAEQGSACNRCKRDIHQIFHNKPDLKRTFREELIATHWPGGGHFDVDHIVPTMWGGTCHLVNLQILCKRCHTAKSAIEAMFNNPLNAALPATPKKSKKSSGTGANAHHRIHVESRPAIYTALWKLHQSLWHLFCPVQRIATELVEFRMVNDRVLVCVKWNDPQVVLNEEKFVWGNSWLGFETALHQQRGVRALVRQGIVAEGAAVCSSNIKTIITGWNTINGPEAAQSVSADEADDADAAEPESPESPGLLSSSDKDTESIDEETQSPNSEPRFGPEATQPVSADEADDTDAAKSESPGLLGSRDEDTEITELELELELEAKRKAKAEAERKAKAEAERKAEAKAEAEAKRKAEAEADEAKAEAEAKRKAEAEADEAEAEAEAERKTERKPCKWTGASGGILIYTFHPLVSGRGHRMKAMVRDLLCVRSSPAKIEPK